MPALALVLTAMTAAMIVTAGVSADASEATTGATTQQLRWTGGSDWQNIGSEAKSVAKCDRDTAMIGRSHQGDENGPSSVRCTYLRTTSAWSGPVVRTSATSKSGWIRESAGTAFSCPSNQVMSLRLHVNDENGGTQYRCQSLELFRGKDSAAHRVQVGPASWSASVKESGSSYTCPRDSVLVGRQHSGDENGSTRYRCATLSVTTATTGSNP